jgi:hypothetical protein
MSSSNRHAPNTAETVKYMRRRKSSVQRETPIFKDPPQLPPPPQPPQLPPAALPPPDDSYWERVDAEVRAEKKKNS